MKQTKKNKHKTAPHPLVRFLSGKNGILLLLAVAAVVIVAVVLLSPVLFPGGVIPDYRPPALTQEESLSSTEAEEEEKKNQQAYEDLLKDILYTYGGQTVLLTDKNYAAREDAGKFFKEYTDAVKAGDWESYQRFFAEGYFNENETKIDMTPQRLYDIEISYHSESKGIVLAGKSYDVENFTVKYKILANDGTFRDDVPSDVWKPQIYQIAQTSQGYCIVNILNILGSK